MASPRVCTRLNSVFPLFLFKEEEKFVTGLVRFSCYFSILRMEAAPFLPTIVDRRAPFFSFIKNHRFFYVEKNGERCGFFYSKNLIKTPSNCGRSNSICIRFRRVQMEFNSISLSKREIEFGFSKPTEVQPKVELHPVLSSS